MALYKELIPETTISRITQVQFSIPNPEHLKKTPQIVNHNLYTSDNNAKNFPEVGGLYDTRLGVVDSNLICATCKHRNNLCPGHTGHIILNKPVFYMHFITRVLKILNCICFRCSKILLPHDHPIFNQTNKPNYAHFDEIVNLCKKVKKCANNEHGCGTIQPTRYYKEAVGEVYAEWKFSDKESRKDLLRAETVLEMFKRIPDKDVELLTFSNTYCRPDWLICSIFPISPPSVRPSIRQDNNQRSDDDLTYKAIDIIKANDRLNDAIKSGKDITIIDSYTNLLQYHIATYIDNETPFGHGVLKATVQRSGRELKSLRQRLKTKEGRVRGNLMGKRVDYSSRSVITPDPVIDIDQLGVPYKIANNITFPEKVNQFNIEKLKKLIINGPFVYPGAKSIRKYRTNSIKYLKNINRQKIASEIEFGDTVYRHLLDNDVVLFNRQPSLHKMSMMSHRIKVMDALTFRLNVCATKPYNADFDGDEMNMHVPQSLQTVSELKYLSNVNTQIINPLNSGPIIVLVQDAKLGIHYITKKKNKDTSMFMFNKQQTMNLMMHNKEFTNIKQLDLNKNTQINGEQIISSMLPPINLYNSDSSNTENNLQIVNGNLKGTISKEFGDTKIIHRIFNQYGKDAAADFLNNSQGVLNNFLFTNGFSVGIGDLIITKENKSDIGNIIDQKIIKINKIIDNIINGSIEKKYQESLYDECELLINKELNDAISIAGTKVQTSLDSNVNRFLNMSIAGSKGSNLNLSQMIACVGQQNVDGKRIPLYYNNRSLPHFSQFDNSSKARGFVKNSFYNGLDPIEYYFHAMGGREGLIDTAVKTSETGYIQRKLVKTMEDWKICYDNTVRNHNEHIIQLQYGDDGFNPTKLEKQTFNNFINIKLNDFEDKYKNYINTDLKYILIKEIYEETIQEKNNPIITNYYKQLLDDRINIINNISQNKIDFVTTIPMNIDNIIINNKNLFNLGNNLSNLDPLYIINTIAKLNKIIKNKLVQIFIRFKLSPYNIIIKNRIHKEVFNKIIEDIKYKYITAFIDPGEMVGVIGAQSIGSESTQMTLNTFHMAGVSSKSSVTRGIPRLKELLQISKNLKSPSTIINLKEKNVNNKYIKNIANNIILIKIKDIVSSSNIYFDPDDTNTIVEEDKQLLENYISFQNDFGIDDYIYNTTNKCPLILRLIFNKYKMLDKNVSMIDIYNVLLQQFGDIIHCLYSDDNQDKLIFRIRYKNNFNPLNDDLDNLKILENNILKTTLSGISPITNIDINKETLYEVIDTDTINKGEIIEYESTTLETSGTNLLDILCLDYVDTTKTYSNDIYEMLSIFGIEAARHILYTEMYNVMVSSGASVNKRHIVLLADIMTYKGYLMSVDRFGIKNSDFGILAQCSFEETPDLLSRASIFGESDNMQGVSGNIMFGQTILGGTGLCDIIFDESSYFANYSELQDTIKSNINNIIIDLDNLSNIIDFNKLQSIDIKYPEINMI